MPLSLQHHERPLAELSAVLITSNGATSQAASSLPACYHRKRHTHTSATEAPLRNAAHHVAAASTTAKRMPMPTLLVSTLLLPVKRVTLPCKEDSDTTETDGRVVLYVYASWHAADSKGPDAQARNGTATRGRRVRLGPQPNSMKKPRFALHRPGSFEPVVCKQKYRLPHNTGDA